MAKDMQAFENLLVDYLYGQNQNVESLLRIVLLAGALMTAAYAAVLVYLELNMFTSIALLASMGLVLSGGITYLFLKGHASFIHHPVTEITPRIISYCIGIVSSWDLRLIWLDLDYRKKHRLDFPKLGELLYKTVLSSLETGYLQINRGRNKRYNQQLVWMSVLITLCCALIGFMVNSAQSIRGWALWGLVMFVGIVISLVVTQRLAAVFVDQPSVDDLTEPCNLRLVRKFIEGLTTYCDGRGSNICVTLLVSDKKITHTGDLMSVASKLNEPFEVVALESIEFAPTRYKPPTQTTHGLTS